MHKIEKIYLDMDGVIADFIKRYKERYKMEPKEAERNKEFDKYFDKFIADGEFATLDLMPGARELIDFLKTLPVPTEILSSTASQERYDAIALQKMQWLQTHNIPFKPNFVPGKRHKWKFSNPSTLIIDDTGSVIDDWRKEGGVGILHLDPIATMAILKMYV